MFIWFVMEDNPGSLWQSGIYRDSGAAKLGAAAVREGRRRPLSAINGKLTVKGGTRNPTVTVYLREYCSNNPVGATVGYTVRGYQGSRLMTVKQGAAPLGVDCTIPVRVNGLTVPKKQTYRVTVDANTATTASILRTITIVGV